MSNKIRLHQIKLLCRLGLIYILNILFFEHWNLLITYQAHWFCFHLCEIIILSPFFLENSSLCVHFSFGNGGHFGNGGVTLDNNFLIVVKQDWF